MAKQKGRPVNGILLLDKPKGISSNAALQTVKRLYNARKAGHTGSLDPLATGMLPLCFGEATKFSQFLLEADKTYEVTAHFGLRTTTSDSEGEVVSERDVPTLTPAVLDKALEAFRGEIDQVPSMYSAIKINGEPLYKLARQGITVDRPSRRLQIFSFDLCSIDGSSATFSVHCSKGTYVRTLIDDLGEALGCGAHVTMLRRTRVAGYPATEMITAEQLQSCWEAEGASALDQFLLPADTALKAMDAFQLSDSMAFYFKQGQAVFIPNAPQADYVRLYSTRDELLGVGRMDDSGKIAPKRLVNRQSVA